MEQTKKVTKRAVIQTNLYDWIMQKSLIISCIGYWIFCICVGVWFIRYLADKEIIIDGTNIVGQYIDAFKISNYINWASIGLFLLVITRVPNELEKKGISTKTDETISILFLMTNIIAKTYYWITHTEFLLGAEKTKSLPPAQSYVQALIFFSNLFTCMAAVTSTGIFVILVIVIAIEAVKYPCTMLSNLIKKQLQSVKFNYVKETVVDVKEDV